jgi:poly(hydroxyalkanoate) depolymerase family esterase
MTPDFSAAMRQAAQFTRAQKLMDATRVIQRSLMARGRLAPDVDRPLAGVRLLAAPLQASEPTVAVEPPPSHAPRESEPAQEAAAAERLSARTRRPLGELLKRLRQADLPGFGQYAPRAPKFRKAPTVAVPDGAAYLTRTFACAAGSRDYKVYVPSRAAGRALPLVVMLHGCTQHPDDFAVGTGMNRLAEEHGVIVAYPGQAASANPSACWNWFHLAHQRRDEGEPAIIAGITGAVMAEFAVDQARVYVAGLSAGGAMAAVMSATYPELYAAAGIHSGLPYASAADLPSAFAAMRGGSNPTSPAPRKRRAKGRVRTIVFHGASDRTVDPSNAEAILADARAGLSDPAEELRHDGFAGGRAYTRTIVTDARGVPHAECWAIDGLGHAWSGGSPEGSFTDHRGPDASREMLRFFLERRRVEFGACDA